MDIPNAFIGHEGQPTTAEIASALGATTSTWDRLISRMAEERDVADQEWKSTSPKYGWSLLLKRKKRTIVYLGPCAGCFRVSFVRGDRAVAAARQACLPASILKLLDEAPRYAEGTGLRIIVKSPRDLPAIQKLVEIKLAN